MSFVKTEFSQSDKQQLLAPKNDPPITVKRGDRKNNKQKKSAWRGKLSDLYRFYCSIRQKMTWEDSLQLQEDLQFLEQKHYLPITVKRRDRKSNKHRKNTWRGELSGIYRVYCELRESLTWENYSYLEQRLLFGVG
ncbi:MAG: hypothetical protein LBR56_02705, partial [Sporomusaceae bacterium]|nr:hypothetical protein [Sporomusaceae bacterium]